MPNKFYGCIRHEPWGSEDCSKIAKFWAKTISHGHRSGDVNDVQRRFRFAQKEHNWWRSMDVLLWQSSQWKRPEKPTPKKARQVRTNVKVLITVFFDCNGVVHYEFLPQDRTVNKVYYLEVMRRLREAIRQKRTELWKNQSWILHHDNAPAYTSMLVHERLAKNKTVIVPQPLYYPVLVHDDFFFFPKLKTPMKGKRLVTIEEIKEKL